MSKKFNVNRFALVDMLSQVAPFSWGLINRLRLNGLKVSYYGSNTKYNGVFINSMSDKCETLELYDISSSLEKNILVRLRGLFGFYLSLIKDRALYDKIIIQFPKLFMFDLLLFLFFKDKVIYLIHNAVPHSANKKFSFRMLVLSSLSCELWFLSDHVKEEYDSIYGSFFKRKRFRVVGHGLIPISPGDLMRGFNAVRPTRPVLTYWGNIKKYKGVFEFSSLLLELQKKGFLGAHGGVEIYGKIDASLEGYTFIFQEIDAKFYNGYLDPDELKSLFNGGRIFVLPYLSASQSGVLYTLLYYGQVFLSTDCGDSSDFLRKAGLSQLIFDLERPETFISALEYCHNNFELVLSKLENARYEIIRYECI